VRFLVGVRLPPPRPDFGDGPATDPVAGAPWTVPYRFPDVHAPDAQG
jgi:hypothetical protein